MRHPAQHHPQAKSAPVLPCLLTAAQSQSRSHLHIATRAPTRAQRDEIAATTPECCVAPLPPPGRALPRVAGAMVLWCSGGHAPHTCTLLSSPPPSHPLLPTLIPSSPLSSPPPHSDPLLSSHIPSSHRSSTPSISDSVLPSGCPLFPSLIPSSPLSSPPPLSHPLFPSLIPSSPLSSPLPLSHPLLPSLIPSSPLSSPPPLSHPLLPSLIPLLLHSFHL
ncbi:unnamed protein product [Closterium sp. Naga37s-1]|nr:unnamed protein product [Closterium sp. Naga37s-1]